MFALAAVAGARADAASTTTVVDVPTRGVTQRFLYVRPDAAVANIVFLPGTNGVLGIENDGSMPTVAGRCAPFVRNKDAFASRGFALALVDQTSDLKVRQFADIREVVRYMRSRNNVPTWIVGGSGSTTGALNFAVEFPLRGAVGRRHLLPVAARRFARRAGKAADARRLPSGRCGFDAVRRRSCSMH